MLALASRIAPASRSFCATNESCGGIDPSSASEPAVVVIRSWVSMLSLSAIGIPCSGPRTLPALRSASSWSAISSAWGLVSMIARSSGPCWLSASIRARYSSVMRRAVRRPERMPSCRLSIVASCSSNGSRPVVNGGAARRGRGAGVQPA